MLLWNLALALSWAALHGRFDARTLVVGAGIGYVLLWVVRVRGEPAAYLGRPWRALRLLGFFLWELLLANLRVARAVLAPGLRIRPGIVAVPLAARTDAQITLLATLVTLTPGTLSVDVSPDRRTLYIHAMFVDDRDAIRRGIKDGFERRVMEVLR
jgi:multicomponent Na+:H+ antiporter subunit E